MEQDPASASSMIHSLTLLEHIRPRDVSLGRTHSGAIYPLSKPSRYMIPDAPYGDESPIRYVSVRGIEPLT